MEEVKVETVKKEKELTETLARLQESVAVLPMLALARRVGRLMDGEISNLNLAVEALNTAMLQVIEGANSLRKSTASKVVEILSPIQIVKFLATAAQFHLQTRRWGLQRDS
ncbi:protein RESPONSE TO ABA AND SALT 1-like [Castanea sativa]|uniref:protein RESPONSE TO ABA AND SALT 1-like n=1 Tax=Castanea sativa TaxID=21020 RepID=UPI003F64EE63